MARVLRIGLTGGIGAGKSTVAARLQELGGVVVDADRIAREVVEPGTPGLAAVVETFGPAVLGPDGRLDRPGLGRIVFGDEAARSRLNAILHPLIGARTAELVAAVPAGAVLVHDVPLLVESGMGIGFHLVVVVAAAAAVREQRLVQDRGMTLEDARARIAAQADDAARRAAADVWLANEGPVADTLAAVDALWAQRILPFRDQLLAGRPAPDPVPYPDPAAAEAAGARWAARIALATGLGVPGDAGRPGGVPAFVVTADPDAAEPAAALADAGLPATGAGGGEHASADRFAPVTVTVRLSAAG